MFSVLVRVLGALALAWPAAAQVRPFPDDFHTQEMTTDDGATIHLRAGGQGPAVVLLHGFGDTGDMCRSSRSAGEQSFGANQAVVMRHAATNVTEVVIPHAGHWLMEEQPAATMTAIRTFLDAKH
jgi:pimeloyl-ACP methyl ester carboxylesterase